jgi:hypothetical protein
VFILRSLDLEVGLIGGLSPASAHDGRRQDLIDQFLF